MSVYINDYKVNKGDIGLINNGGLLGAYKWACDTGQDVPIDFVCDEYDGLVLATHYIENRAIVNSDIMAYIWYINHHL